MGPKSKGISFQLTWLNSSVVLLDIPFKGTLTTRYYCPSEGDYSGVTYVCACVFSFLELMGRLLLGNAGNLAHPATD